MKFNPGKLKKRVKLIKRTEILNDLGQRKQGKEVVRTPYADVIDVRGNKYYDAKKIVPEITHFVYIRWIPEPVEQDMLVEYKGREYEVKSCIDMKGEKLQYEIQCVEKIKKVIKSE